MHEEVRNYVEDLLANQPCPLDTWIHLQSCPKCSEQLEALRRLSSLFPRRHGEETPERDPLFYAGVQARIEALRCASPWRVFLDRSFAKRLVLTCLACTGFTAIYWFSVSAEEWQTRAVYCVTEFTNPALADREAQRNAVLVNLIVGSRPVEEDNR